MISLGSIENDRILKYCVFCSFFVAPRPVPSAVQFAVDLEEAFFGFEWQWPELEEVYQQPRGGRGRGRGWSLRAETRDREWTLVLVFGNGSSPIGFRQPCVTPGELSGELGLFGPARRKLPPPPNLQYNAILSVFFPGLRGISCQMRSVGPQSSVWKEGPVVGGGKLCVSQNTA